MMQMKRIISDIARSKYCECHLVLILLNSNFRQLLWNITISNAAPMIKSLPLFPKLSEISAPNFSVNLWRSWKNPFGMSQIYFLVTKNDLLKIENCYCKKIWASSTFWTNCLSFDTTTSFWIVLFATTSYWIIWRCHTFVLFQRILPSLPTNIPMILYLLQYL